MPAQEKALRVEPDWNKSRLARPAKLEKNTFSPDRSRKWLKKIFLYGLLIILSFIFLLPVFWLLLGSLKPNSEFRTYPVQFLPSRFLWSNYSDALTSVPFFEYALHSLIIGVSYTVLVVITSSFAGFGFARFQVPGRNQLFILVVAMLMVPQIVTAIPQFMFYSKLGLTGTYWPWIIWGLAGSPLLIFLFRQFFLSFPRELEDAAEIDGCSRPRIYWQIFMPNAGPVIAASSVFAFQWVWGDYFLQTLFLNENTATLAMKMATAYVDPQGKPYYTITLAAVVMYVLPLLIVFFVAQKNIVRGVVTTGLK